MYLSFRRLGEGVLDLSIEDAFGCDFGIWLSNKWDVFASGNLLSETQARDAMMESRESMPESGFEVAEVV